MGDRIKSFEDLETWQRATDLTVSVYQHTKFFPKEEQFGLTNQMRRASASIGANIAEGFGRKTTKDKVHFYVIAYGSLLEVRNFIHLSSRLNYISVEQAESILAETLTLQKMINASKKALKHD